MKEIGDIERGVKCLMRLTHADAVRKEYGDKDGAKGKDHEEENEGEAWDDVSGACLDPSEVRRARAKEI